MPTILESIIDNEADILMMIAEAWGIDLQIDRRRNIAEQLAEHLARADEAQEMFSALTEDERHGIRQLAASRGRIFWDQFTREFGSLREMGATRREKERPHRQPQSVTESLFYKGWIGRAFFESGHGIREYAYLPDEFLSLVGESAPRKRETPLTPIENVVITPLRRVDDRLLDHACTMLSLFRGGLWMNEKLLIDPVIHPDFLAALLTEMELLDNSQVIHTERVKSFLEAPRNQSFSALARAWMQSQSINEMDYLPDLGCEGGWKNRPLENRSNVLGWARVLAGGGWYALEDFIAWVHQNHPEFMRSSGEYDAWMIRHLPSGEFLRGRVHWDQVEGAYLRWMIRGPLAWLGILEIGKSPKRGGEDHARLSTWAEPLLARGEVEFSSKPVTALILDKRGGVAVDRQFPLHIRYQIARFCEFRGERRGHYLYQINPAFLTRAQGQGLKAKQLAALLIKYGKKPHPRNVFTALEAWEHGRWAARVYPAFILEVPEPALLDDILASPQKKHILERLSPTTASIEQASIPALRAVLLEQGVLADIRLDGQRPNPAEGHRDL